MPSSSACASCLKTGVPLENYEGDWICARCRVKAWMLVDGGRRYMLIDDEEKEGDDGTLHQLASDPAIQDPGDFLSTPFVAVLFGREREADE